MDITLVTPDQLPAPVKHTDAETAWTLLREEFRQATDAPLPDQWIATSRQTNGVTVASVEPPLKGDRVLIPSKGEERALPFPITHQSKIPVVQWGYAFDRPSTDREGYFYRFIGWDVSTGRMVFDRA